jgi:hypothetical protein
VALRTEGDDLLSVGCQDNSVAELAPDGGVCIAERQVPKELSHLECETAGGGACAFDVGMALPLRCMPRESAAPPPVGSHFVLDHASALP